MVGRSWAATDRLQQTERYRTLQTTADRRYHAIYLQPHQSAPIRHSLMIQGSAQNIWRYILICQVMLQYLYYTHYHLHSYHFHKPRERDRAPDKATLWLTCLICRRDSSTCCCLSVGCDVTREGLNNGSWIKKWNYDNHSADDKWTLSFLEPLT